jgi:AcrR family transcriptional regulator
VDDQPLAVQLRRKRSEMMLAELEAIALRLFEERGFDAVTVGEIASTAGISPRTFYRYFPAKEDVLQVRIDRRSQALRVALTDRPAGEPPLRSLRIALENVLGAEDPRAVRRWIDVIRSTPGVVNGVLGGIQLKSNGVMAEFLAERLGLPGDGVVPTMLAAAAGGVIQAAQIYWYVNGGDLVTPLSQGLDVLERGVGTDARSWAGIDPP